jgi:uncharacterized delta-60 repeat protein
MNLNSRIALLFAFGITTGTAGAGDADRDTSFNGVGSRIIDFGLVTQVGAEDRAFSALRTQSGKYIVAGSTGSRLAVTRLNDDGNIDTGFGPDGLGLIVPNFQQLVPFASALETGFTIPLSGERILAAGAYVNAGSNVSFGVCALSGSGSVLSGFGTGGCSSIGFASAGGASHQARAIVIDPQGNIYVAGTLYVAPSRIGIAKLRLSNGALVAAFGNQGVNDFALNPLFGSDAWALSLSANSKLVVVGSTLNDAGNGDLMSVLHLDSISGDVDTGFCNDIQICTGNHDTFGRRTFGFSGSTESAAFAVATDAQGDIYVAGYATVPDVSAPGGFRQEAAIAKLRPDGSFSPGFGTQGSGRTRFRALPGDTYANAIALDRSGKILISGVSAFGNTTDTAFFVARLNANGSVDNGFANGSYYATYPFDRANAGVPRRDQANAMSIDSLGRPIIAGSALWDTPNDFDFAVVRLLPTADIFADGFQ